MRVGSIGSSYVPQINAKKEKNKPAFKAEVRIIKRQSFRNKDLPDDHGINLVKMTKYAETAYKDYGSDNILLIIKPTVNEDGGNIVEDMEISAVYKDLDIARIEILEEAQKNPPRKGSEEEAEINGLKNYDKGTMARLNTVLGPRLVMSPSYDMGSLFNRPAKKFLDKETLDRKVKAVIDIMMGSLPPEQLVFKWYPKTMTKLDDQYQWRDYLYGRVDSFKKS